MNDKYPDATGTSRSLDRLTIFTFLWACQALVHQEFYSKWLAEGNAFGWLLTILAVAVLLQPRWLSLFAAMLVTSVIYNILKWPFVVNHILVESVVNATLLAAIIGVLLFNRRTRNASGDSVRDRIYDKFAPVLIWMLIVMYYFAFLAKLNFDFVDPEFSCVATMYDDLVRRLPFLPTDRWAKLAAIWSTIAIEAAIAITLTFRRTKYIGVAIGLPFHFILGLVGHRTFSALAFALYSLIIMGALAPFLTAVLERVTERLGRVRFGRLVAASRAMIVLVFSFLIAADLTGHYRSGVGPLLIYRTAWVIWILWSLVIAALYLGAMYSHYRRPDLAQSSRSSAKPVLLWAGLLLVVLNGMSQYLGLKTETCFTMYSNLRTEAQINNHFFMPALRLAGYQDDLAEIIETDHPELAEYVDSDYLITYFELQRVLSNTKEDCSVTFLRDGVVHEFRLQDGRASDDKLSQKHPMWLAKLLYFRPVPKGMRCPCHH